MHWNILFVTEREISPLLGGTERITHTLSQVFMDWFDFNCYSVYTIAGQVAEMTTFNDKLLLNLDKDIESQLVSFMKQYQIDIVICNLVRFESKRKICPTLYAVAKKVGSKVFNCYHAMPGEDMIGNSFANVCYRIGKGDDIKTNIKDLLLNCCPAWLKSCLIGNRLKDKYRLFYQYCDKLVLLSDKFYEPYSRIAQIPVDGKFAYVNNSLSFGSNFIPEELSYKSKEVLILARMHEKSKRLSLALKIWKLIEQNPALADWKLVIVGAGLDDEYFKKIARKLNLQRVSFEGRQNDAVAYYKRASLFMMTSAYEGWGITLMEAQQMGVVPLAFDSYRSVVDIIDDGQTGCIIPNNDIVQYANRMTDLMLNDSLRWDMALKGLMSCLRYSQENIAKQWITLFQE